MKTKYDSIEKIMDAAEEEYQESDFGEYKPSFESFLDEFYGVWIDNLKKDKYNKLLEALKSLLISYRADFKLITGSELNNTMAVRMAIEAIQNS